MFIFKFSDHYRSESRPTDWETTKTYLADNHDWSPQEIERGHAKLMSEGLLRVSSTEEILNETII